MPYYSQHKDDVEYDEFNLLGTRASLGCIRLAVVDVKWIYDNCPLGTPVIIYNDADDPGPMGKPGTIYTDPADTEKRGWDPTDPDPANPWDDAFESGTAIRSQAAWDQWETERENWMSSLTPTDLQGWSTDSKIAGTRGLFLRRRGRRFSVSRRSQDNRECLDPRGRGRACPARRLPASARPPQTAGPGVPGPYRSINQKAPAFLSKAGAFLLQYQLNITTSCAGFSPGSTEMAVRTGPVESGVWPL